MKGKQKRSIILIDNKIIFQDVIVCLKIGSSPIGNSLVKIITAIGEITETAKPMSFIEAGNRLKEIASEIEENHLIIYSGALISSILMSDKISFFQVTEERGVCLLKIGLINGEVITTACDNIKMAHIRMKELIAESKLEDILDFGDVNIVLSQVANYNISKEEKIEAFCLAGGSSFPVPQDKIKIINELFNLKILSDERKK